MLFTYANALKPIDWLNEYFTLRVYVVSILSTFVLGLLVYYLINWIHYVRTVDRIPGLRKMSFIFGDLHYIQSGLKIGQVPGEIFLQVLEGFFRTDEFKNYDGFAKCWLGPYPLLIATCPPASESVLASNKIIEKAMFYDFIHPWLGRGLLTR